MPKPKQPRPKSKGGLFGACIAIAMGVGAGVVVELDPAWLERAVAPAAAVSTPSATPKSARLPEGPAGARAASLPDQTGALPPLREPRTQPEARLWIVEQLDRDMQANPQRRETALNTCVISERGKAEADWMGVRACYQRLIAGSQPPR